MVSSEDRERHPRRLAGEMIEALAGAKQDDPVAQSQQLDEADCVAQQIIELVAGGRGLDNFD